MVSPHRQHGPYHVLTPAAAGTDNGRRLGLPRLIEPFRQRTEALGGFTQLRVFLHELFHFLFTRLQRVLLFFVHLAPGRYNAPRASNHESTGGVRDCSQIQDAGRISRFAC
jgi:hypothetical protein